MIILVSPAKKIEFTPGEYPVNTTMPHFLNESELLINSLKKYDIKALESLMKISPALAELNFIRYNKWQKKYNSQNSGPAIFLFKGDVYQGININTFNDSQLEFTQKHLRILSGMYGVLRPMDLIQPYRLEMGTKLPVDSAADLYHFWDNKITDFINQEIKTHENKLIINLASDEYFKSVKTKNISVKIIKPVFKDEKNGKYKIISFYAKKARGLMTRFIVENSITDYEKLKAFDYEKYTYSEQMSSENEPVFIR